MKTKSKEFQLKITPGAALKCPRCGREDTLNIYDGDSIPTHESMLDATTVAGGLALSKDGFCFYDCLNACVCRACGTGCHIVDLHVVNNSDVSREWADTHFWLNGETREPELQFSVDCRGGGLPAHWAVELSDTDEGLLVHFSFGPFITREALEGSNGVANCAGGKTWDEASALIARVWPLVTRKRFDWPESFTIRGNWPLREVEGWKPRVGRNKNDVLPA